jgi:hypothetical protein
MTDFLHFYFLCHACSSAVMIGVLQPSPVLEWWHPPQLTIDVSRVAFFVGCLLTFGALHLLQ